MYSVTPTAAYGGDLPAEGVLNIFLSVRYVNIGRIFNS